MKHFKRTGRSFISVVLMVCLLFSGTAVTPATVAPAQAVAIGTVLEKGFGLFGTIAGAIGPAVFGKILNATGQSELADYLGLNKANEVTLEELKETVDNINEQVGTISEQVTALSDQLASTGDRLESWTTLTAFQQSYGGLSSNNDDYLQTMEQLENGDYSEESYQKQLGQLMETIYKDDTFREKVVAMGDAIMGDGSSLKSPTKAYYEHRKQVDGTTRDQLIADYMAFSTSVYQDYVISLMLCNAAMTYLAEQDGGNALYEIQMNNMAQQAQRVKAFLYNERQQLFPADQLDGVNGGSPRSTALSANDYVITYTNGQAAAGSSKQGASTNDLFLSEYYLMLNVGESTAVKAFSGGQEFGTWKTSDPSVAVVDQWGGVFATGAGTATLTVSAKGHTKQVQVDVLDVDSNGLPVTTTTGTVKNVTKDATFDINDLLKEAGVEDATASDYTWTTTDANGVTVSDTTITGVANSGGYSMVIGTRQVRYDTDGGSFYAIEKVIFPFEVAYDKAAGVYDFDDLLYQNYSTNNSTITLATDLTADSPYGQICQETKLRPDLLSRSGLTVNGQGHRMDLMGARLMQNMNNASIVKDISLYSSCIMDDAAVVDNLPATATIQNVDINVTIVGSKQYLGGAANTANGRIDGVSFYGSITNNYTSEKTDLTSAVSGSATLPREAFLSLYDANDNDENNANMYATGTGGIVGRQDVNARKNGDKWENTQTNAGIYNCYSNGDINAATNTGGIAGLVVSAWSIVEVNNNTAFDPVDMHDVSVEDPANAAYVPVYASVSASDVTATANDGIAGGVAGFSIFADIKGGSVTGSVTGGSAGSGRASGVSGIYLPTIWRSIPNFSTPSYYSQGSGCLIDGVLVGASLSSGSGRVSPYYYDDMDLNYWESGEPFDGSYQEFIEKEFEAHDLYQSKDKISEVNSAVSGTIDASLKSNSDISINNGWPIFSTTDTSSVNGFKMNATYEYGSELVPAESLSVTKIEYAARGTASYGEAAPTNVGEYTARATFMDGKTATSDFEITPRIVALVDPEETALEFEDRELTVKSPYISNAIPGDEVEVIVEKGSNKGTKVGEYTLKVTGLTGADAANYKLPAGSYEMPWSITISDQKPAKIALTMNDQPLEAYTLYYNDDERMALDLSDITVTITDENGYAYIGEKTLTWSFDGDGAALSDNVLTASRQGEGTLTATIGDVSATVAITIAEKSDINTIAQGDGAAIVRVGTDYDLTTVPLTVTDTAGNPYVLTEEELQAITWEVWAEQSEGVTADVEGTTLNVSAIDGNEGTIVLKGTLSGVSWTVKLTVRQQPVATTLNVTALAPDAPITLTPNTTRSISDYLTAQCFDQYGDKIDADITWTSDNTDMLTIQDNAYFAATTNEGTVQVTASVGELKSEPITVTVAGAPRLTTIAVSGAPAALGWYETLDLDILTVTKYDQNKNELTSDTTPIYWSLSAGDTEATKNGDTILTGAKNGTITLTASTGSIEDSVTITVGPKVTGLTVNKTALPSTGGDVTVTLDGDRLAAGITVALFDADGEQVAEAAKTVMNSESCQATLAVPTNDAATEVAYTVKVSYDGISYLDSPTAALTVAAAGTDPVIEGMAVDPDSLSSSGGDVTVALTGKNLREGFTVGLFNGDTEVTTAKTAMDGDDCTATLTVPANSNTSNMTYTVKVSIDGENYLNEPTASLTVAGKSGGSIGGGGGGIIIPPLDDDHDVTIEQPDNGKIEISDDKAEAGDEVTITVTPDDGYVVDKITITDEDGNEIEVTANEDGNFSFTMPDGEVSIEAEFVEEGEEEPPVIDLPFTDVADDAWYAGPVQFVYEQGLMTGVSETDFGPNLTTTRGMIVTMLYRLQGEPAVGEGAFTDVNADAYYADAVTWAAENGIVSGYGNMIFGPNDAITREHLAAILYRYCEAMGYEISARSDLSAYSDADSISNWATDVISWAHAMGLINGVSKTELAPQATATRAQVAAILERFLTIDWEA